MSIPPLLNGPIPPFNNPAIQPQFYKPRRFVVSAITNGPTTIVTTSVNHDYVIGQQCRLLIPAGYGCTQLNELDGFVISIPSSTQVELTINSQNANAFISISLPQQPQILAIGDINSGSINRHGRTCLHPYIPGSFRDISPR